MKVAIHHRDESFSVRWIEYCRKKSIPYVLVDCYQNDIVDQVKDCDVVMWHYHHVDYRDMLFAKELLYSLSQSGKRVFPDLNTGWHFDDKIAQKYLLEAIEAPLVPTFVFFEKMRAIEWARETTFPKVFKLKSGAGAANVRLVKSESDALRLIKTAFGRGFSQWNKLGYLNEQYGKYRAGNGSMKAVLRGLKRLVISPTFAKMQNREKGYVYFQEFIPNNSFDIRVVVVGDRAFALKRLVRKGDFRASGSGNIVYDKEQIDRRCLSIAFKINKKTISKCTAFDFVFNSNGIPLIIEMSYGFAVAAYDYCEGFWDSDLNWHPGAFNPQEWMIEDLLNELSN